MTRPARRARDGSAAVDALLAAVPERQPLVHDAYFQTSPAAAQREQPGDLAE